MRGRSLMNKRKHSFERKARYWFDNRMAEGFGPKVRLLLIITVVFVFLIALLAALTHGGVHEHFVEDFIRSFMYSLGKGGSLNTDDLHVSVGYFLLMLLMIIYCMFFSAILIGLISNALRTKVDDLGRGHSPVVESGHTLILGYNDSTMTILKELTIANRNLSRPETVVILGDIDQKSMIEQIKKEIGWPNRRSKTRFVCRTGSTCNFDDLKRCSIETSKAIIINDGSDFESIKSIMACSHLLREEFENPDEAPFLISIIQNEDNLVEARLAAGKHSSKSLVILALNEVLARIMVHTSRQPGLSDVFTELFNFTGSELYIIEDDALFPGLHGKTIAEINHYLANAYAIGVKQANGAILMEDPLSLVFEDGDALIVVKEDDDPLKPTDHNEEYRKLPVIQSQPIEAVRVLIIGIEPVLDEALREYSSYLPAGSEIRVVSNKGRFDRMIDESITELLQDKEISVSVVDVDTASKRDVNKLLHDFAPDCVLVLANIDTKDPDSEDERIMRILIYLRAFRNRSGKYFSITCEMLQSKNKTLAAATEPDDFIISRQFSALMMAQISYDKSMASLFECLLSSDGFEIYMKPAVWYLPAGEPVSLFTLGQIVADRGEIFIGMRQKSDSCHSPATINPGKYNSTNTVKEYTFSEGDYLVVLAENNHFPEYKN